ncbi:MAG: MFS transporter, partial [Acidimicrobiia bacterium]
DPKQVGMALAAVGLFSVIVQGGLVRPLVKRIGQRRTLMVGGFFGTVGFALYGIAGTVPMFWVAAVAYAPAGIFNPTLLGLLTKRVGPSEQGKLQGANASLSGIGGMLGPGLFALTIDRTKALAEYVKVQIGVPQFATMGPLARAFDALASTAPGVREVITLGKVLWEVQHGGYDLVVADCPPTGAITGLLRAPRTIAELVPSGRVRHQAEWMSQLLSRKATELVLVTLAEELPTVETQETMALLASENLVEPPTIVTNRVLPRLETDAKGSGVAAEAATLHRSLYRNQQDWMKRLPPARKLPYLFGLLTPGEVAARMADAWEHSSAGSKE